MILRSLLVLVIAAVFLAWRFSGINVLAPSDASPVVATEAPVTDRSEAVDIPAESSFTAVVERPLFREDRRPPAEVPAPEPALAAPTPAAPKPVWRLIGIGENDKGPLALLLPPGGTETLRAREGDVYDNWTILSVGGGLVTLQDNDNGDTVQLSLETGE